MKSSISHLITKTFCSLVLVLVTSIPTVVQASEVACVYLEPEILIDSSRLEERLRDELRYYEGGSDELRIIQGDESKWEELQATAAWLEENNCTVAHVLQERRFGVEGGHTTIDVETSEEIEGGSMVGAFDIEDDSYQSIVIAITELLRHQAELGVIEGDYARF
ncbi:hypothetical protein HH1059_25130 [Halorhodospira halochloris]|uniref:Uncharacterized protein n=1 Tax=Halorhodospira halochloris TaxID=1052 RepID=A0A110B4E0_HALHR|nr:hypothetical protein [Halorhodospira halochloris]MBK1650907.1 hypothetical protein [Halorhodospira halochloris]BAU56590.1 hypothetical protein HH1059_25130 [Halorhodospira halochloris]